MSLSPNEKYPGATEADPNYKDSKFKDNNPSTTNNGSPLKALDRNEQLALQEAMMNAAGFDYNGVVDTPQNSQMFAAYKAALSNGANLLSNHNFLTPSPDDSQPAPDATPRSYPPGYQIFSGVFANETTGISNLTYIDGRVSFSGGDFYMAVPNTGALENITEFVSSVADFDGKPRTRGVSFALVGDEYRVTVGVDALEDDSANATLLGSVKFEKGSVSTGHEAVDSISDLGGRFAYQADSVSDMISKSLTINYQVGQTVTTDRFYADIAGGGGTYDITSDTPNGFNIIGLSNGLSASLRVDDAIDVQQVGARPQNDKRFNELEDQYDAEPFLAFAFSNFKSVKGSGRYLCRGVLRTPKKYGGGVEYKDDYRWSLQGYNEFEIVFDLTVVPDSERSRANETDPTGGYAVGFGLAHKDYTKPNEWENGSNIYDGLNRNISIRDVSFWNRNWNTANQDNDNLALEVGFSLFAGADITVDNVVVWGFKVNFMTSCWASTFTNIRPRNGEYGFVPYAGTTITASGVFAGSNKHAITTAGVPGLHATNPITYGLTLNCPATDESREMAYRFTNVYGLVVNVASMEAIHERGIVFDDLVRDVVINGNVLTPYTATQDSIIRFESLNDESRNISIKNFHGETSQVRQVMVYIQDKSDLSKITFENVTCENNALLTNQTEVAEKYLNIKEKAFYSRNNISPVNNKFTMQISDVLGIANNYGEIPDDAYDFYGYSATLKLNDGVNFFIYEYDLVSNRGSGESRGYGFNLINSYNVGGALNPPALNATVSVLNTGGVETLEMAFNPSGGTTPWNILGLHLEFKYRN